MKKLLTTKTIDALKPPSKKRDEVRDVKSAGLVLRVSRTGTKVWYFTKRINREIYCIKIGEYPAVTLSEAREQAQCILHDIHLGKYAKDSSDSPEDVIPTLEQAIDKFIELYAKPGNRTWKETRSKLGKFEHLYSRPITEIRKADIIKVLDDIVACGTATRANRVLAAIKKLMNWCVDRDYIEVSPIATLKAPTKEEPRHRVLSPDEILKLWAWGKDTPYPFGPFIQLLLLTGQRRGEVSGMRWSEVDFEQATWTLPAERVKNNTLHVVPLSTAAQEILKQLPRFQNSDYVFTTTGISAISGFGKLKQRLEVVLGSNAEDWRLHDLRRTVATNMAQLGIQPHIIEAVLNHKSGIVSGVAAVYNRHSYDTEKREALKKWATLLNRIDQKQLPTPQKRNFKIYGDLLNNAQTNFGA